MEITPHPGFVLANCLVFYVADFNLSSCYFCITEICTKDHGFNFPCISTLSNLKEVKSEIYLKIIMGLNFLKLQMLRGSWMRRLILKVFAFGFAMIVVSILHITHDVEKVELPMLNNEKCLVDFGSSSCDYNVTESSNALSHWFSLFGAFQTPCKESENLTRNVFEKLMKENLLDSNATALCVGVGSNFAVLALRELGFSNALGVNRHPFFSLLRRRFVYELGYADEHFDFVFSQAVDRVSVPALLVLEIERVLRPGGTGAMLVGARDLYSGSLIRSATPVSSFLKRSEIVHVCGVGLHTLVIFKKRFNDAALLRDLKLSGDCPAIINNKPFMQFIEPLVDGNTKKTEREVVYLPKVMNISSRKRLIYVNVGIEESTNFNISELLKPYNSMSDQDFNVYLIDHNASVLSSHVKDPGITFIYHPGLADNHHPSQETDRDYYLSAPQDDDDDFEEYLSAPWDNVGFDFIHWFKETVDDDDFVVLRINAHTVKYNIIEELFTTGAICHVDELFLRCSDTVDCKGSACGHCMNLFQNLRNSDIFVHQWFDE